MSRSKGDRRGRGGYPGVPSWWNKACRRAHRAKARQDLTTGTEPSPKYQGDRSYYW